ncbi:DUF1134 domain-containing protein [Sphingomonas colocasiae]|uniref:DUF1134 domain-containing protein n=1 Tax=Sphingomonas colocasiae TaxID=1848973 RepID=A0ABS7PVU7_9SPHN|nr:DUF1134 domain-containing protein [Sphingomonas colocasiae]MBY8825488.1 DUF1134 domain-containing protein [Sphingomonas colocasiae]
MLKTLFARSIIVAAAFSFAAVPATAQVRDVDPNEAIDADLLPPDQQTQLPSDTAPAAPARDDFPADSVAEPASPSAAATTASSVGTQQGTFQKGDLIGAAEGVFGRGAQGLAKIIEDILKDQGEPNAYITGSEASGAIVVGLRYGSGMLHHKVEGERKVYWTGPSIGFDMGGNASKSFVLVYNLYDSQELYRRYPQGEGTAYFVGGFTASYLRRGDVVLIPIRLGAGLRLGANIGYMKFSEKGRWVPF